MVGYVADDDGSIPEDEGNKGKAESSVGPQEGEEGGEEGGEVREEGGGRGEGRRGIWRVGRRGGRHLKILLLQAVEERRERKEWEDDWV